MYILFAPALVSIAVITFIALRNCFGRKTNV